MEIPQSSGSSSLNINNYYHDSGEGWNYRYQQANIGKLCLIYGNLSINSICSIGKLKIPFKQKMKPTYNVFIRYNSVDSTRKNFDDISCYYNDRNSDYLIITLKRFNNYMDFDQTFDVFIVGTLY